MSPALSYTQIFSRAWPIILANAAVPLLGLIDTAVIGNLGKTQDIGAIALGALVFNFVYWSFGFLRMGTTGFTAQAAGAESWLEVRLVLGRAVLIAFSIALLLLLLHRALGWTIFKLFQASEAIESQANAYFNIRIWGAPATLATFALLGTLVGLGKSRQLLWVQLFLNTLNAFLDILFAGIFDWGVTGIAWGTLISEYCAAIFAALVVYRVLRADQHQNTPFWSLPDVLDRTRLIAMLQANRDIMIRTILLVFSFAWFTNQGAQFGDATLAANHVLLQLINFSAFFLDGYAFVAESIVGTAIGARRLKHFDLGIWRSSVMGAITALALALLILGVGEFFIAALTDIINVRTLASRYLLFAALYVVLSVAAFQLDGVFIGAVRSAEMRNASIVATAVFLLCCEWFTQSYGNNGLWWAFIIYVVMRALCLLYYYPRIRKTLVQA